MIRREHTRLPLREGDAGYVGEGAYYADEITLLNAKFLTIGNRVAFGFGCWINALGQVAIGDDTLIGPGCIIHSANHVMGENGVERDQWDLRPVVIQPNCWLGAGVIVLPGAEIATGTIVGAGAVVSGQVSGRVRGPKAS